MFFRNGFNYDADQASLETGLECKDPSMAQQQFAEEADINTIVNRFGLTGELPTSVRMPTYADFDEAIDYHSAMNVIAAARESFMSMPAQVRARFGNDAGAFVAFCSDESNRAEAEKLGLVVPAAAAAGGAPTASAGGDAQ